LSDLEFQRWEIRIDPDLDVFIIWQLMVLAIGVAVLYGRRTGPIVTTFYTLIAVGVAFLLTRIGG